MLRDDLEKLYARQQESARNACRSALKDAGGRDRIRDLSDAAALSLRCMQGAIPDFGGNVAETGSWISGAPLPLQLLSQPRLTVDLTLAALDAGNGRLLGMSVKALIHLAEHGHVYLNLRDYDSDRNEELKGHLKHESTLGQLLDAVPGKIYFGSAVRKPLFDELGGGAYERLFNEAKEALSQHATRVPFRKAHELPAATFWHWAYLNSVHSLLPEHATAEMQSAYDRVFAGTVEEARKAFGEFARTMRLLHLNFTAPLTASFGTTYNMTDEEYLDSMRMRLDSAGTAQILEASSTDQQAFLSDLFVGGLGKTTSQLADLCSDPIGVGCDVSDFSDDSINGLIRALANNGEQITKAHALMHDIWSAYLDDGRVPNLLSLVEDYRSVRAQVVRISDNEKSLERIFKTSTGLGAAGLSAKTLLTAWPWLAAVAVAHPAVGVAVAGGAFIAAVLGAEGAQRASGKAAAYLVPRAVLRAKRYRILHRVHKLVAASKA